MVRKSLGPVAPGITGYQFWPTGATMFRAMHYTKDGQLHPELSLIDVAFALQEPGSIVWADFSATPPEEDEPILRKTFNFHPLAIDDALQESHVPKVDDWGEYLYIVLHAVVLDRSKGVDLATRELDIFIGKNYIVTHHDDPITAIDHLWDVVQRDTRHFKQGVDNILYRIADEIVASYMPVVEDLDLEIDQVEEQLFDRPEPGTLEHIFNLKRIVLHLRRILGPQREVMNKLARDDYQAIDSQARVYFRDVYDHLVRLYDISESVRDMVSGILDTYLSVVNNRMNEVMKTLTVITTLFMPLSFVVGFFGMNYFTPVVNLDIWTGYRSFVVILLITFLLPLSMFVWIRRRGWM
jgi:magnesium transporter